MTTIRHRDLGPLHDLLLLACPPDEDGRVSIPVLARHLNIRPWSIFKWIYKGKIPPLRASQIVDIADGRVTLSRFSPYIYR